MSNQSTGADRNAAEFEPTILSTKISRRRALSIVGGTAAALALPPVRKAAAGTTLAFDHFLGAAGSAPSGAWKHQIGSTGYLPPAIYVNDRKNSFLDGNSNLVLRATTCTSPPTWFPSAKYQSPLLTTKQSFSAGTNTIWEARIKFDPAAGCWPCFWVMGKNGDWPACGELDIIEVYGASLAGATVHSPIAGQIATEPAFHNFQIDDDWHTWRLAWTSTSVKFWQDYTYGKAPFFTVNNTDIPNWVYNGSNPMYILLNMTVGGPSGESPTRLPVDMLVDYVYVATM